MRAVLDTSVLIARETGRPLEALPEHVAISVVTLAELEAGVLVAADAMVRAGRLATLVYVQQEFDALPIDSSVASAFAQIVSQLKASGRRIGIQDAWIAATALANECSVATQDSNFDFVPGLNVVKV